MTGTSTLAELAALANGRFVEAGGKDSLKEAIWHTKKALNLAEVHGIVKLTRPTDITVEKIR